MERREVLSSVVVGAAGVALTTPSSAQNRLPPLKQLNEQKAVMPNGEILTREQIIRKLGMDPNVVADKWLTIGCGVNSVAVEDSKLKDLVKSGAIEKSKLDKDSLMRLNKQ